MEFDTHDDDDDDMGLPPPASGAYGYASPTRSRKIPESPAIRKPTTTPSRYRECLKNHAVSIGGHAIDGCGEFMPGGEDGTLDALKCAACNCHRNFHRKETDGEAVPPPPPPPQFSPFYRSAPTPAGYLHLSPRVGPTLALPSNSREDQEEDVVNPSGFVKKRFRTKFSQEQKEKMLGFAEKIGWKIQKHDEAAVQQFCMENCVKRHVLKVWMHNNKNTLGNSKTWAQSSCREDKVMEEGFQEHSKDENHQIFGSDEI